MSKKKILLIVISVVVLAAVCVSVCLSGMFSPYERQIKVAYKLLEEGNYEEAILAFDKAIEIDVKKDKAYIGKADVYVARCDENTLEDVKAVIEVAFNQHYNDNNIIEGIIRLADELVANGKIDWAKEFLDFGYELTGDGRLEEHKSVLFNVYADGFLDSLYAMFEAGDYEAVRSEIQSDKYLDFVNQVDDNNYKYIYFPEKNNSRTGKGIALYYVDTESYGKVFVYYGDFENGIRSGNGIWAGANGIQYYWFDGQWSNDAPNGEGELFVVKDESKIEKEPGYTYSLKNETRGTFKDGKYHGSIYEVWHMNDGDTMTWNPITVVDGVYQEMTTLPDYIINEDYVKEKYAEGEYIVSMTESGSDLWSDGSVKYILGFK